MGLTTINVWLDVLLPALFFVVLAMLAVHFLLFVYFGRFRSSFGEGHWPEHDSPPPATPKALHLTHVLSVIVLVVTGMYLRFPFFSGGRMFMRDTHLVFMVAVIAVLIARLRYAFFDRDGADWREFAIGREDLLSAAGFLAYYGYFSQEKPHVSRYNVLQKLTYGVFLLMILVQVITGLALLNYAVPGLNLTMSQLIVGWNLGAVTGSPPITMLFVRVAHYAVTWLLIILATVHLYLALTVDTPRTLDFFGLAGRGARSRTRG